MLFKDRRLKGHNMKKITCTLCFILMLFFVGCDQSNTTTEIQTSNTTTQQTTTEEPTTIETTTRQACAVYDTPDIDIVNGVVTTDSYTFGYDIVTPGCNGYISDISITDGWGGGTVYTFDNLGLISFTVSDLNPRTLYYIRFEYTYDYMQNSAMKFAVLRSFITESEIEVSIINPTSTTDSISFVLDIIDPNSALYIDRIHIEQNGDFIGEIPVSGPYTMTGLDPNTEYTVYVRYFYHITNKEPSLEYETVSLIITTEAE